MNEQVHAFVDQLAKALELAGVAIIVGGVVLASLRFIHDGTRAGGWQSAFPHYRSNIGRGILLGLELLVAPGHRLPQLTTVMVPEGTDDPGTRARLLADYGIEIGAGAGQLAGRIWRIGCMGNTARRRNVVTLLAALREVLGR